MVCHIAVRCDDNFFMNCPLFLGSWLPAPLFSTPREDKECECQSEERCQRSAVVGSSSHVSDLPPPGAGWAAHAWSECGRFAPLRRSRRPPTQSPYPSREMGCESLAGCVAGWVSGFAGRSTFTTFCAVKVLPVRYSMNSTRTVSSLWAGGAGRGQVKAK